MVTVGDHPNVINLFGACTRSGTYSQVSSAQFRMIKCFIVKRQPKEILFPTRQQALGTNEHFPLVYSFRDVTLRARQAIAPRSISIHHKNMGIWLA